MQWNKYTIHTTYGAEEAVNGLLLDLGISSIEIEDRKLPSPEMSGGLFGDVVPDWDASDDHAVISFYTDGEGDDEELLKEIREKLSKLGQYLDIGTAEIVKDTTREEDWIDRWKEHFHSFYIDDILIVPGWEEEETVPKEGTSLVLHIDPGTAFGTGAHESTRLAIRAIRKYLKKGDRVLDIGTGSGILGIVALKSGASSVFGTDLDENTLPAIEENLMKNEIPDGSFEMILGDIAKSEMVQEKAGYDAYDLCCANIIAEILCDITPQVPAHLKKGGIYVTSGILTEKEDLVIQSALASGMSVVEILHEGEWSGIVFKR